MMKYKKYNFLFMWGLLITAGSAEQIIRPASKIPLIISLSLAFALILLAVGLLLMVSYFVINRYFQVGKKLAVIALLFNMIYFLIEYILEVMWLPNPIWAKTTGFGLAMALLVGYMIFLCRKRA